MKKQLRGSLILLLTAIIWGTAFVAQSTGMDYIGGYTFNCIRSIIGGIVLIPCIFLIRRIKGENGEKKPVEGSFRMLMIGGVTCGILLCLGSNLQQQALKTASVGKAGFITALYIVLVPVVGLFFKKKVGVKLAIGVALAVSGLYMLCITEGFGSLEVEDYLLLFGAVSFTFHILAVDYFVPYVDGVALSCIQFFVCGILSGIPMLAFEKVVFSNVVDAAVPILYAGVMSCGVAYTLQIIGQKDVNPTLASMILSLESVVSVLAGFILLGEKMSGRELIGCVLMFVAIIITQLPDRTAQTDTE